MEEVESGREYIFILGMMAEFESDIFQTLGSYLPMGGNISALCLKLPLDPYGPGQAKNVSYAICELYVYLLYPKFQDSS